MTPRSVQRQGSAASNAALLSGDERTQHADALLRYFAYYSTFDVAVVVEAG